MIINKHRSFDLYISTFLVLILYSLGFFFIDTYFTHNFAYKTKLVAYLDWNIKF